MVQEVFFKRLRKDEGEEFHKPHRCGRDMKHTLWRLTQPWQTMRNSSGFKSAAWEGIQWLMDVPTLQWHVQKIRFSILYHYSICNKTHTYNSKYQRRISLWNRMTTGWVNIDKIRCYPNYKTLLCFIETHNAHKEAGGVKFWILPS